MLRWVNEKRIGNELHMLYRDEKNELVLVVHQLNEKGNKVGKGKAGKKADLNARKKQSGDERKLQVARLKSRKMIWR